MIRFLFITFLLLSADIVFSQEIIFVEGTVYDSITNRPIKNANIKISNKKQGTITDSRGHFLLKVDNFPVNLKTSHVSYHSKNITIKNSDNTQLSIPLKLKTTAINQINISAKNKIVELTKKQYFDINDFEFRNDTIVLITYDWQKKQNPWIVLINNFGDTLLKKHIPYDGIFYKDCLDNLYLINENYAYQIYIHDKKIIVDNQMSAKKFKESMNPCVDELNGKLYLKQYTYDEQVLSYFSADTTTKNIDKFKIIADKTTIRRLYDKERFYSMGTAPTDADLRFEKMCFFAPVFAPLIVINDTVCIFDFVNDKIEYFNNKLELTGNTAINFHKDKIWKHKIIVDKQTGNVYTVFRKNSITTIKQIDKKSGKIIKSVKIPHYQWISNIKIYDNNIYFLYKKTSNLELTRLFKLKIL